MALRAFFDASTRQENDIHCLAGVAFGVKGAKKATAKWRELYGGRTFRMAKLNARLGDFKGISQDEKDQFLIGSIDIIKKYAAYIVVVSFRPSKAQPFLPKNNTTEGWFNKGMALSLRTPYSMSCNIVMNILAYHTNGDIFYNFELGDDGQAGTKKYIEFVYNTEHLRFTHRVAGLNFHNKESELLSGASDLVAWECGKFLEGQAEGKPMRKSLAALMGVTELNLGAGLEKSQSYETDKFNFQHFGDELFPALMPDMETMLGTTDMDVWRKILDRSKIDENEAVSQYLTSNALKSLGQNKLQR